MRSFIAVGGEDEFENYLKGFVRVRSIPIHSRYNFGPGVKIRDAREIKKILSIHSGYPRLIVLRGEITTEAQNALLKSVEELPSDTFIIFSLSQIGDLLPTVISRCSIIRLGGKKNKPDTQMFALDEYFSNPTNSSALLLTIFLSNEENGGETLLCYLSQKLDNTSRMKISELQILLRVGNRFFELLPLVKHNNLNQRMVFDEILMGAIKMPLDKDDENMIL